jgi:hypothetical protein
MFPAQQNQLSHAATFQLQQTSWAKVATAKTKSRQPKKLKPQTKKQPETQRAHPESRNFHQGKSRNLKKIKNQKNQTALTNQTSIQCGRKLIRAIYFLVFDGNVYNPSFYLLKARSE